jgi:hypothetical protein
MENKGKVGFISSRKTSLGKIAGSPAGEYADPK